VRLVHWRGHGAAPLVWNGLVFIGKAGGDWGIRGGIMALKVEDGSLAWRFDVTPTGDEIGADTWQSPGTALHGGGASWVDLCRSTALPKHCSFRWEIRGPIQQRMRPGANLFTKSVVALDARSGTLSVVVSIGPNDDHDGTPPSFSLSTRRQRLVATAGRTACCTYCAVRTESSPSSCPSPRSQPRRAAHAPGCSRVSGRRR